MVGLGLLDDVSHQLGVSTDQIKLILLLVGSVPLSLVFPYLPSSTTSAVPHLFALVPSFFFLYVVLDLKSGFIQLLASSIATWILVKWGVGRKEGKAMPWKVFSVVMGHLTVNHIIRHLDKTSLATIEITGSQMVLCMKLISFAWSAYDGTRPIEELDATQKVSRITEVPGLVPFLGYCFFFPSILAGPSFTYASYNAFTSRALFKKEKVEIESKHGEVDVIPPGRRRKAAKRFFTGLFFLTIYSLYGSKADYQRMLVPSFQGHPFFKKVGFMQVAGFVARTKYYAVWCIAESAFILSGLGYNPVTTKYDASRNVRIRSIEFAPNFKILFDSWNINTNVWLRECIYKRVTKQGKKPGFKSTQITFITSALWHGVNPCYLMTFILGGFFQSLGRSVRSLVRPFVLPPAALASPTGSAATKPVTSDKVTAATSTTIPPSTAGSTVTKPVVLPVVPKKLQQPPQSVIKWTYDGLGIIMTQLALNFAVAPFMLLTVNGSIGAWKAVNFYGLWLMIVPFTVLNLGGANWLRVARKKRDAAHLKKEEVEVEREIRRREWEEQEKEKRSKRGEQVAGLGMDVEALAEEEGRREA